MYLSTLLIIACYISYFFEVGFFWGGATTNTIKTGSRGCVSPCHCYNSTFLYLFRFSLATTDAIRTGPRRCVCPHCYNCTFLYLFRFSLATTNAIRTGSRGCTCPHQRARLCAVTWFASSATASTQPTNRLSPRSCLAGPSSGGSWQRARSVLVDHGDCCCLVGDRKTQGSFRSGKTGKVREDQKTFSSH